MKIRPLHLITLAAFATLGSASLHAQKAESPALPAPGAPPLAPEVQRVPPARRAEDRAARADEREGKLKAEAEEQARSRASREGEREGKPPLFGANPLRGRRERGSEPAPFLGVVTAPVPAVLAAQLGLREGFGLVVEEVLPDSPAQAAGLKRYDVLKLLNEQQLVDVAQLTTLVRGMSKDTEVTLTFLRNGKEQTATVKLAEKMLPPPRASADGDLLKRRFLTFGEGGRDGGEQPEQMRRFQERMKKFHEEMERYQTRMRDWRPSAGAQIPQPPEPPQPPPPPQNDPFSGEFFSVPVPREHLLHEARPGGAAEVRIDQPDGHTTFQTSNARVTMQDQDGQLELATENGKRTLTAKNPAGETIFTGPVDTPEQRARVPAPFAGKLDLLADENGVKLRGKGVQASASSSVSNAPPSALPPSAEKSPESKPAEDEREVQ